MFRKMLRAKIHRARVTETNLEYEGSITIDRDLLEAAGIVPYEQLRIANLENGERFETYVIPGPAGSGVICVNGAAAHKARPGDLVIIFQYVYLAPEQLADHHPVILHVDGQNRIVERG